MSLEGKRILITGASSGIGRALAFEFGRRGAMLALAARNVGRLHQVADQIGGPTSPASTLLIVGCDVTRDDQVRDMVKDCMRRFGGVDILVNSAGTGVYGAILRTSLGDFREVMEVNMFGALRCILEVVPSMKRQRKGHIVNILSMAALHGVPFLAAYSASKAALLAACQSLQAELAGDGISILNVHPNYTETDFFRNEKKVGGARRPSGPFASPAAVARAVANGVESGKDHLVLSAEGKALRFFDWAFPGLVENAMARIARRLGEAPEVNP